MNNDRLKLATFGGGCFWCVEAILKEVQGVANVISGYSGGNVPGVPTYREVSSGLTGHAEVVQVTFDSEVTSYGELLAIFMASHDPTVSNVKATEFGSQYRSVIYYHNAEQQQIAQNFLIEVASDFDDPITTEIRAAKRFHPAEEYHQNFYGKFPTEPYCDAIIRPKLAKLRQLYANKLKIGERQMTHL